MALAPWRIRVTADGTGTLDAVHATIELVDRATLVEELAVFISGNSSGGAFDLLGTSLVSPSGVVGPLRADGTDLYWSVDYEGVRRLSADGSTVWETTIPDNIEMNDIYVTGSDVYVAGYVDDGVTWGATVTKMTTAGAIVWTVFYPEHPDGGTPFATESLAADATGVWVADSQGAMSKLDTSGTRQWVTDIFTVGTVLDMVKVDGGNLICASSSGLLSVDPSNGSTSTLVAGSFFFSVALDVDGNIYATESERLHKRTAAGAAVWDVAIVNSSSAWPAHVRISGDGRIVVSTRYNLEEYDADGNQLSSSAYSQDNRGGIAVIP